jgi:hypothetical protein
MVGQAGHERYPGHLTNRMVDEANKQVGAHLTERGDDKQGDHDFTGVGF